MSNEKHEEFDRISKSPSWLKQDKRYELLPTQLDVYYGSSPERFAISRYFLFNNVRIEHKKGSWKEKPRFRRVVLVVGAWSITSIDEYANDILLELRCDAERKKTKRWCLEVRSLLFSVLGQKLPVDLIIAHCLIGKIGEYIYDCPALLLYDDEDSTELKELCDLVEWNIALPLFLDMDKPDLFSAQFGPFQSTFLQVDGTPENLPIVIDSYEDMLASIDFERIFRHLYFCERAAIVEGAHYLWCARSTTKTLLASYVMVVGLDRKTFKTNTLVLDFVVNKKSVMTRVYSPEECLVLDGVYVLPLGRNHSPRDIVYAEYSPAVCLFDTLTYSFFLRMDTTNETRIYICGYRAVKTPEDGSVHRLVVV